MVDLEQKIRDRAYQIWEQEGRIHGRDQLHWHMAKLELVNASDEADGPVIEAAIATAEPVKKSRRAAKPKEALPTTSVVPSAPRRRRSQAPLQ